MKPCKPLDEGPVHGHIHLICLLDRHFVLDVGVTPPNRKDFSANAAPHNLVPRTHWRESFT